MTEAQRLMQRGEARGAQTTLLKLLRLKFRAVPDAVTTLVEAAKPDQVDRWLERVLTASTIDEVIAG